MNSLSLFEMNTTPSKTFDYLIEDLVSEIESEPDLDKKVEMLNRAKEALHNASPFKNEPVDCVVWKRCEKVQANDYNPNKVAPPEMELLEVSILNDGYTQPIVTWPKENDNVEVVDGFHRSRVGRESAVVKQRVQGYLPTVLIRKEQQGKNDRVASTIRHNRARGKHQVDAMSEIVLELKNRNWTNSRIARELGMDEDEILRLCQITGLESLFSDKDFSQAWESEDSIHAADFLDDTIEGDPRELVKTANTSDPNRVFHTFDKWECQKAGFYATNRGGLTVEECAKAYDDVAGNKRTLRKAIKRVIAEWPHSCEHYLTNTAMNRLLWLIMAAVCVERGVSSTYLEGIDSLDAKKQDAAYEVALSVLNGWLKQNGRDQLEMSEALSVGRQVEIY